MGSKSHKQGTGDDNMRSETKAERFRRLAEKRTERVLDGIRKLANLANRHSYDYSQEDVEKIFGAIQSRLDLARQRFKAERALNSGNSRFKL